MKISQILLSSEQGLEMHFCASGAFKTVSCSLGGKVGQMFVTSREPATSAIHALKKRNMSCARFNSIEFLQLTLGTFSLQAPYDIKY